MCPLLGSLARAASKSCARRCASVSGSEDAGDCSVNDTSLRPSPRAGATVSSLSANVPSSGIHCSSQTSQVASARISIGAPGGQSSGTETVIRCSARPE